MEAEVLSGDRWVGRFWVALVVDVSQVAMTFDVQQVEAIVERKLTVVLVVWITNIRQMAEREVRLQLELVYVSGVKEEGVDGAEEQLGFEVSYRAKDRGRASPAASTQAIRRAQVPTKGVDEV